MFSTPVREIMDKRKLLLAEPTMTVRKAAEAMAKHSVGAALVVENHKLVGIFTERDVVFRVVARGLDSTKTTLGEVMTREPKTIAPDKTYGVAMLLMHENKFRHLPVVENDEPIGIVSSRSALDPDLEEFVFEERRRKPLQETR
jgi:CBS domain-containing protein